MLDDRLFSLHKLHAVEAASGGIPLQFARVQKGEVEFLTLERTELPVLF
jgi:hypothetical protein